MLAGWMGGDVCGRHYGDEWQRFAVPRHVLRRQLRGVGFWLSWKDSTDFMMRVWGWWWLLWLWGTWWLVAMAG